jgi:ABC-type dipeptide/oligopeptide/nickel transport system permease subunit
VKSTLDSKVQLAAQVWPPESGTATPPKTLQRTHWLHGQSASVSQAWKPLAPARQTPWPEHCESEVHGVPALSPPMQVPPWSQSSPDSTTPLPHTPGVIVTAAVGRSVFVGAGVFVGADVLVLVGVLVGAPGVLVGGVLAGAPGVLVGVVVDVLVGRLEVGLLVGVRLGRCRRCRCRNLEWLFTTVPLPLPNSVTVGLWALLGSGCERPVSTRTRAISAN